MTPTNPDPATSARVPTVAFVTDIVTPYMVAVLAELAARVDLVAVFCAETGSRGAEWAFGTPLPFRHRVLRGPTIQRPRRDGTDLYPNPAILRTLLAARPDVVISGGFSLPTLAGAIYGRLTGGRLIIHSDGTAFSERNIGQLQRLARRLLVPEAAACVGNSEPAARRFIELGAPPGQVFRALHTTHIAPFHEVARQRAARPRDEHRVTVLNVGRLIPRKGIDRLLHAVADAAVEHPLRLILVGTGPEEARLRALSESLGIAGGVEFRGFIDQPDLPAIYAEADIFAFPTLDDPFGIVLIEAAGSGLPLVASPFGGATLDLVEEGRNGFVVDPRDTRAWARALVTLARDRALRRTLGDSAHASTLERTPAHAADGYAAAVHAALGTGRRPNGIRRIAALA
jgi:glycosyltransferase involved in cell wall biosynthesis